MAKDTIIHQITVKPVYRAVSDVGKWREALKSADLFKRAKLYNLYEDLLIDGVLSDAVDKRIEAITNSELAFQVNGEAVEDIDRLMDTPAFEDMLTEIMNAKFWGISVLEFDFLNGFNVTSIPRKHIRPDLQEILREEHDERGIPYADDPFIVQIGNKNNLGIYLKTAPYAIYKRGGFGDYAQWIELFGMPQRIGKYSAYDSESKRLLEEAFDKAGSAPSMVVPKETDVETNNQGQGGNGKAFNDFRNACNEEMLITILGQTMTTLDGSSRSQSEVHMDVQELKHKSDRRFVQRILNYKIKPLLEARGFPVANGEWFFPEAGETLSTKDRLDNAVKLNEVIDIDEDYFYENFDIPKPEKGAVITKKKSKAPDPSTEPVKEPVKNADEEKAWYMRLVDFFVRAPQAGALNSSIKLADEADVFLLFDLEKLFEDALKSIFESAGKSTDVFDDNLFNLNNLVLQQGIEKTFLAAGTDWGRINVEFAKQFRSNTAVFSAFKAHRHGDIIARQLLNPDNSLRSFSEFKRAVKDLVDPKWRKEWLQTEYNTAVRSARSAANWKKFQSTKDLYPNLEYMPSLAANPRDSHRKFYGTILPQDHPFWRLHVPPSDWNCMCWIRASDAKVSPAPDGWQIDGDPVFQNNPGVTAEFVRIKETDYYKDTASWKRDNIEKTARLKQK